MAASSSKPVVRTPKAAPKAAPKPAPKPPAVTTSAPKPDRGRRIRVCPEFLPEGVVLDSRNPFPFSGRMYGFFGAFLEGDGVATVDRMVEVCMEWSVTIGADDNPEAAHRDVLNRVKEWRDGTNAGRQITCTREGNTYTCVAVKGVPWAEAVGKKRA